MLAGVVMLGQVFAAQAAGTSWPIDLQDYTGRGFAPDVVTYSVARPGGGAAAWRLTNEAGESLPVQAAVEPDAGAENAGAGTVRVRFVTDLPPNGARHYVLHDDAALPAAAATRVVATPGATPGTLELSNGLWAIRVPATGSKTYPGAGVAASTLPAPILAFRSGTADWAGASKWLGTWPVTAWSTTILEQGPVCVRYEYRLTFADGGWYRAEIRVADQVPLAMVREEYDLKSRSATGFWELALTGGNWLPNRVSTARPIGNGGLARQTITDLSTYATKNPLTRLVCDSAWGSPSGQFGLFTNADPKAETSVDGTMVGWIPLYKGDWRRANTVDAYCATPAGDGTLVTLQFPVGVRPASWLTEVTSETSPFSMQEHEPGLPTTYGRRVWGLQLAAPALKVECESGPVDAFYQARLLYGVIGLDHYKNFQLDWPTAATTTYPRVFATADTVATKRAALATAALTDVVKDTLTRTTFIYGGALSDARQKQVLERLRWMSGVPFRTPTLGHHHIAANYEIAAMADDALGWPELPAEVRTEIRRRLALITYCYEEGDTISYANGAHPGNPNMGTARIASANVFVALLPDHPMYPAWQRHLSAYTTYKTAIQTAPGGGYFEFGAAYHMHGGSRVTASLPGLTATHATELPALYRYWTEDWRYYMDLLTPYDSNWRSRMIPGMANSPPGNTENFLDAAGALEPADRDLAANLLWAWHANGERSDAANLLGAPVDLQPVEPALHSAYYPGVGVVFRAHQGPNETYLFMRSGYNWSHWYIDQGHFILYSRGAALAPFQPFQYKNSDKPDFDLYNTVRFGHPENQFPHGWPDSNVLDYAFGPTVDYAWSSSGYPEWYISPGATEAFRPKNDAPIGTAGNRKLATAAEGVAQTQTEGAFDWNRQVMFLKGKTPTSPNYFVFRDTTTGAGKLASWTYLNILGKRNMVTPTGPVLAVTGATDTRLDYIFPNRETVQPEYHDEIQPVAFYNTSYPKRIAKDDPNVPPIWTDKAGEPLTTQPSQAVNGAFEPHTFVRLADAPGLDQLWIAYPRGKGDAAPTITRLDPSAVQITHAEGDDYAFLSPTPITIATPTVVFDGYAGAIRVRPDSVTLALTSGTGRIGYKGYILTGNAPFEQTIPLAQLTPGVHAMPPQPPATAIVWQAPERPAGHVGAIVLKSDEGGVARYTVDHTGPVQFDKEDVHVFAAHATVEVSADRVRFITPDAAYVKLTAGSIGVRGLGPFDLTFQRDRVTGRVDGRERTLVVTWPTGITRPAYYEDGMRWLAGWADDHSYANGLAVPQFSIAFGVHAGSHEVEIKDWTYPALPPAPATATLVAP